MLQLEENTTQAEGLTAFIAKKKTTGVGLPDSGGFEVISFNDSEDPEQEAEELGQLSGLVAAIAAAKERNTWILTIEEQERLEYLEEMLEKRELEALGILKNLIALRDETSNNLSSARSAEIRNESTSLIQKIEVMTTVAEIEANAIQAVIQAIKEREKAKARVAEQTFVQVQELIQRISSSLINDEREVREEVDGLALELAAA